LPDVAFPEAARVLQAGRGSGAICPERASWPQVGEVVGLDPSPALPAKARSLLRRYRTSGFRRVDARSLPYEDEEFDAVVFRGAGRERACSVQAKGAARSVKPRAIFESASH
jgi:ubiquinone/menaquinone biosynthesis C-methylase UbiE